MAGDRLLELDSGSSRKTAVRAELERAAHVSQRHRQESLTQKSIRLMLGMCAIAATLALLEEKNDVRVTLLFYSPIFTVLSVAELCVRIQRYRLAGWIVSLLFWAVVAAATWFFGGLKYEMGTAYVISVVLAGATLGSRAALGFGFLSTASASFVAWAQVTGVLPDSLAPESVMNAWIALIVSLLLAAFLLHTTIQSTQEAWSEAARAAREKDHAEAKYLVAQRLEPIGRMASGVAHDFNNILNVIFNVSDLLRSATPSERDELLDDLDAAARRGELMTRQLLSFNHKREVKKEPVNLNELLRTVAPVLGRLLGDEIEVVLEPCPHSVWILADRGQLEQILMNLTVNAREAMPEGGQLTVRLSAESEEEAHLTIIDTGRGMDETTSDQAFEPFFSTKEAGTGLGLATVRDVVQRHGGRMRLASAVGSGTTFTITLPRIPAGELALRQSKRPTPPPARGLRVLLVEDEPHVRRAHARSLESMGHDVITVSNGAEALCLVTSTSSPDVIVSDVSMPVMTGIELAQTLAKRPTAPPLILITGHLGERPLEVEGNSLVRGFFVKPVNSRELENLLATITPSSGKRAISKPDPPNAKHR